MYQQQQGLVVNAPAPHAVCCNVPAPHATNPQARQKLSSTCGSISQLYGFVEQATEATAAQLESTRLALQQHAAKQPATAQAPLEPGPGQVCVEVGLKKACAMMTVCCTQRSASKRVWSRGCLCMMGATCALIRFQAACCSQHSASHAGWGPAEQHLNTLARTLPHRWRRSSSWKQRLRRPGSWSAALQQLRCAGSGAQQTAAVTPSTASPACGLLDEHLWTAGTPASAAGSTQPWIQY